MITNFRLKTEIADDRELRVILPNSIPAGPVEIEMRIVSPKKAELDWQEQNDLAFAKEVAAFERMKPELLEKYRGQFVAIYQGEVAAYGDKQGAVFNAVLERYGPVVCYIEKVELKTPRQARIASAFIKRK